VQARITLTVVAEDVVLGPPKTAFSSSSRFARTNASTETTAGSEDAEGARARTFGDRQQNRNPKTTGEKEGGRDWTALRQPRGPDQTEEQKDSNDRLAKYGRRDREREQDAERRNGDKQDSRWGQREDRGQRDERRQNGERQGGWRDRESNRQNNRGWDREQAEKEPEWFDEPMKKQEEDLGVGTAHTQADFQKWKEMMKGGNKAPAEEVAPTPPPPPPVQSTTAKQVASMKLDNFSEPMFGGLGSKATDAPLESIVPTAKAAATPSKTKSSRFASVFKKDEAPPAPVQEASVQQQPMLEMGQGLNEDRAGFQRILQMLGGANIGSSQESAAATGGPSEPASPQVRGPVAGAKQKSRFFDSVPKSPDVNSPQSRFQSPRVQPGNNLSATRSTTRTVSSAFPCPRRRLRIRPRCHSLPATLFLPNLLSLPTAIEILTRCSNVQVSPSSVLRHRAARLHVVLPLPMLEFRICLQLSELKDPTPRTRTASSCLGFSRVLLSRLVLTKTSGLASHQSRMRQSHVRLRLLA
jgi:hypothetical protein